jgi:hypothetical protein
MNKLTTDFQLHLQFSTFSYLYPYMKTSQQTGGEGRQIQILTVLTVSCSLRELDLIRRAGSLKANRTYLEMKTKSITMSPNYTEKQIVF